MFSGRNAYFMCSPLMGTHAEEKVIDAASGTLKIHS